MRVNGTTISKLFLQVIWRASIDSEGNKETFLKSVSASEKDFTKWCADVDRSHPHETPMSYDVLRTLTEEKLKQDYLPRSTYPRQTTLRVAHNLIYTSKCIRSQLEIVGFSHHHDFYKALVDIPTPGVEGRTIGLTHADLLHFSPLELEQMVGTQVYDTELSVSTYKPVDYNEITFPLLKLFIDHFKTLKQPMEVNTLASYFKIKGDSLKKHISHFENKEGKPLSFKDLIDLTLDELEKNYSTIKAIKYKGKAAASQTPFDITHSSTEKTAQKRRNSDDEDTPVLRKINNTVYQPAFFANPPVAANPLFGANPFGAVEPMSAPGQHFVLVPNTSMFFYHHQSMYLGPVAPYPAENTALEDQTLIIDRQPLEEKNWPTM